MSVNEELTKEEETYLYIIEQCQKNSHFGKVLFNKILYFSDFDFYEGHEKSITSGSYKRDTHGPVAIGFEDVINKLKDKGYVGEKPIEATKGHVQIRYFIKKQFNRHLLSGAEIKELERNIMRLGGMTARQVSEYSHQDMPYKATKDGEAIDYELVFYRNPIYSVNEHNKNL